MPHTTTRIAALLDPTATTDEARRLAPLLPAARRFQAELAAKRAANRLRRSRAMRDGRLTGFPRRDR